MMHSFLCFRLDRAFTLVEILIAIAIISAIAVAVAPSFTSWSEKTKVRKVANQIVTDIQFLKMKAVSEGTQHRISFRDGITTYAIEKGNKPAGSDSWMAIGPNRMLSDETSPYYTKGVAVRQNCPDGALILHPDGSSGMGTIKVAAGPCNDGKTQCQRRSCERCFTVIRTGRLALIE